MVSPTGGERGVGGKDARVEGQKRREGPGGVGGGGDGRGLGEAGGPNLGGVSN